MTGILLNLDLMFELKKKRRMPLFFYQYINGRQFSQALR
jgi:hypothetical protein